MQQNVLRHARIDRVSRGLRHVRSVLATLVLVAAVAVAAPAGATGDASSGAFSFIQGLGNDAIKELTDRAIPRPEREARFRRLLNDHFDIAAISKFVLGRYYRSISDQQRAEFQRLFVDFMVGSYSVSFSEYMGKGLTVTGAAAADGDTILVHSKIDMPSAADARVDWRLRPAEGRFAIVDIIVEGVSMEVTQRSQFASMIQDRGGVDGLIAALRTKTLQSASSSTQQ
jgi:phospholipid transport system substrate-binding protein